MVKLEDNIDIINCCVDLIDKGFYLTHNTDTEFKKVIKLQRLIKTPNYRRDSGVVIDSVIETVKNNSFYPIIDSIYDIGKEITINFENSGNPYLNNKEWSVTSPVRFSENNLTNYGREISNDSIEFYHKLKITYGYNGFIKLKGYIEEDYIGNGLKIVNEIVILLNK